MEDTLLEMPDLKLLKVKNIKEVTESPQKKIQYTLLPATSTKSLLKKKDSIEDE